MMYVFTVLIFLCERGVDHSISSYSTSTFSPFSKTQIQSSCLLLFLLGPKNLVQKKSRVKIAGLGSFKTYESKARNGRNPSTGAAISIPAKERVRFIPVKDLKERLNKKETFPEN
jgi:nucleoid DNA-binding protein